MLTIKHNKGSLIEVTIIDTLKAEDFRELGEKADKLIKEHGSIRVLINASGFNGWDNTEAAEKHFGFVKEHNQKVERLAVVAGHMWQYWLAALARMFLQPKIRVFDKDQIEEARAWLKE